MSGLRIGPAIVALAMALGLSAACATAGDGDELGLDLSEAGTGDDVATSSDAHHDSASNHDSATGSDGAAGGDAFVPFDSGTVDSSQPDAFVTPDAAQQMDASVTPDASGNCSVSCTNGCCNGNTCVTSFSDSLCPTSGAAMACEDCASEGATCLPFLPGVYLCF